MLMAVVPLLAMGQSEPSEDGAAPGGSAPDEGFTPYQTILDRMPFGPLPANFNPDAPPGSASAAGGADGGVGEVVQTEEEQQIVASVRVSVLNKTPAGAVAVGFTDSSVQPPKHYYLKVGEKSDIWEVKDADPAEQTVVLVKNGVEATLKVGEGTSDGKGAKAGRTGGGMLARNRPMPGRMAPGGGGGDGQGQDARARHPSGLALLRDRRRRSLEDLKAEEARRDAAAAQARKDADQARKDAAQAAAEREQQREALLQIQEQIQEELRRQREEREQRAAEAQESRRQGNGDDQSPE